MVHGALSFCDAHKYEMNVTLSEKRFQAMCQSADSVSRLQG